MVPGTFGAHSVPVMAIDHGPVAEAIAQRAPFGPMERLPSHRLRTEQLASLASPRRTASLSARALFAVMDLAYGTRRTLQKFRVLELVARVPYQAWENVAYVAVTHTANEPGFARRVFDRVRVNRWEQDNEQWHLLILNELIAEGTYTDERRLGWFKTFLLPQAMAFGYYQLSWLTYAIKPAWSYRLNADFEDHAEHEYAHFVAEHPEFELAAFTSEFADDFGHYDSLADLFRQIAYDERLHKQQSEAALNAPRFT